MSEFKVGDSVRWVTDVNKVYSKDTKTLVGKVGKILPPREYYDGSGNMHLTRDGLHDVVFLYGDAEFIVGNIPEPELVKVEST